MGRGENDKYTGVYVIVNRVRIAGSKEIFHLQIVDKNTNTNTSSMLTSSSDDHRELLKTLLSKYVPLCTKGQENYRYRIPQIPISDKMIPVAKELKRELKEFAQSPTNDDPGLRRIKHQLIPDIVQDIENQLKLLENSETSSS